VLARLSRPVRRGRRFAAQGQAAPQPQRPRPQHFEEKSKGSLEVGKLADLVILSADPTAVDPLQIEKIQVLETVKAGRSIYRRRD